MKRQQVVLAVLLSSVAAGGLVTGCNGSPEGSNGSETHTAERPALPSDCPIVVEAEALNRFKAENAGLLATVSVEAPAEAVTCQATASDGSTTTITGFTHLDVTPSVHVTGAPVVGATAVTLPATIQEIRDEVLKIIAAKLGPNLENLELDRLFKIQPPKFDLALLGELPALQAEIQQRIDAAAGEVNIIIGFASQWQKDVQAFIARFKAGDIPLTLLRAPKTWNELGTLLGLTAFSEANAHLTQLKEVLALDTLQDLWKRLSQVAAADLTHARAQIIAWANQWISQLKITSDRAREALQAVLAYLQGVWKPSLSLDKITPGNVLRLLDELKLLQLLDPAGKAGEYLDWFNKLEALLNADSATRLREAVRIVNEALLPADKLAVAIDMANRISSELGIKADLALQEASVLAIKAGFNPDQLDQYIEIAQWLKSLDGLSLSDATLLDKAEEILVKLGVKGKTLDQLKTAFDALRSGRSPLEALLAAILAVVGI